MSANIERKIRGQVMQFLEEIRKSEPLTHAVIAKTLDGVCQMYPVLPPGFDRAGILATIEEKVSIWIGDSQELVNDEDHKPWLTDKKPQIEWGYWDRYRGHVISEIGVDPVTKLDDITDRILSHLEDPEREGAWDRRGLVVGHVQSGKTSNYTGLICKAADAGYKIIIVLAGLHKNLRSQTQIRLEEGFLGYDNSSRPEEGYKAVGVGLIDPSPNLRPDSATNRSDDGDFTTKRFQTFAINPGGRPLVFVVKKNVTVLENLIDWATWAHNAIDPKTGKKIIKDIPLLLIDDEADHASVNTKEGAFDAEGNPDKEHNPSTINRLIRRFLTVFQQKAYIGYTATPFANIFINEQAETEREGPDLFPSSFIVSLPAPSDYFGPAHIFGQSDDANGSSTVRAERYVREIEDHADSLELDESSGWLPPKHKNGHIPHFHGEFRSPPSLKRGIHSFILATAVRRLRGQLKDHNSMLVHVSRFTSVQHMVKQQIDNEVQILKREFRYGETEEGMSNREKLRDLFEADFEATLDNNLNPGSVPISWHDLENEVRDVVTILQVKEINGSAGDILDYEEESETGLVVIAVGGDKLSRGLTLQGLSVSYFLRATKMYDTLMQMGRWFGYRRGYEDVCRLFMTADLREWFENITVAAEELRQEFDHMAAIKGTPRRYGLRVRSHPVLLVTSRVKMRSGQPMKLSYAGTVPETITFHRNRDSVRQNHEATLRLIETIGAPDEESPVRERSGNREQSWKNSYFWQNVEASTVLTFLSNFSTHEDSVKANSNYIRQYISKQLEIGDLKSWGIAILSGSGGAAKIGELNVTLVERNPLEKNLSIEEQISQEKYVIGRLVSPRDEAIDLDAKDYDRALDLTKRAWHQDSARNRRRREEPVEPSGTSIRNIRNKGKGLLLLYPLDPNNRVMNHQELPIMAAAVSFPTSESAIEVDYIVNNVFASSEAEL